MDLIVRVKEIKGRCPVYKVGDEFKIQNGWILRTEFPICMHSLASIMPYYNALKVLKGGELGLNRNRGEKTAYVQCLDPYEYTDGGTVIFEISIID